jgi:TPR repeat protein
LALANEPVNSRLEFAPVESILNPGAGFAVNSALNFNFYTMSGHRRTWDTFEAMRQAAEEGDAQAQCYLGVCFQNGHARRNRAIRWRNVTSGCAI